MLCRLRLPLSPLSSRLAQAPYRSTSFARFSMSGNTGGDSATMSQEWTTAKVRESFVDYFVKDAETKHTFWKSSATIPHDDPTLLFTNAGMNQFKPIFLGTVDANTQLGQLKAAANSQKCIRAGGKHNDLDDVGKDVYHHTFFEMLGNWSFNNTFFKEGAIKMSWKLLTEVWGLDKDRLYVSYFGGDESDGLPPDDEARDIWLSLGLEPHRVLPFDKSDNFWEMGDTGPCGPCSEIHYDRIGGRDASKLVNMDDPDVLEIWNLVFMQFNRDPDGLRPLPNVHVDTGLGLERISSILCGKMSNYDTDAFTPFFEAIEKGTKAAHPYTGKIGDEDKDGVDMAYRVLADHIRTLTVAIADGGMPDNVGRGYVLRLILRRAIRFGDEKLGAPEGFFPSLVPVVQQTLGGFFTELTDERCAFVKEVLEDEEKSFRKTLARGKKLFEKAVAGSVDGKQLSGETVWRLWDTYGFPVDLTKVMAEERGLEINMVEFASAKEKALLASQGGDAANTQKVDMDVNAIGDLQNKNVPATNDDPKYEYTPGDAYSFAPCTGTVLAIRTLDKSWTDSAQSGDQIGIVLDKTNFYGEQGGQTFDTGFFTSVDASNEVEFTVKDVQKRGPYCLHVGTLQIGSIKVGDTFNLHIDTDRRFKIMCNHTATHVMNFGLRKALGEADQKGSFVGPERLRFDFTSKKAMNATQIKICEDETRKVISDALPVYIETVELAPAMEVHGLRAMFGEAYPDPVRMVSIGAEPKTVMSDPKSNLAVDHSVEFCGGTHVTNSSHLGAFALVSEEAVAKGIRRVEALTGDAASKAIALADRIEASIKDDFTKEDVVKLTNEVNASVLPSVRKEEIRKKLNAIKKKHADADKAALAKIAEIVIKRAEVLAEEKSPLIVEKVDCGASPKALNQGIQKLKKALPRTPVMFFGADEKNVSCYAFVPKAVGKSSGLSAKEWLDQVVPLIGGKSGGSAEVAQCMGDQPSKISEAITIATKFVQTRFEK